MQRIKTGKDRTFVIDDEELKRGDDNLRQGKGLFGGDLTKNPSGKKSLSEKFPPASAYEINTFDEDEATIQSYKDFLSSAPVEIEVGFGKGQFIIDRARRFPDTHFVGFEIHRDLCLSAVKRIHAAGLTNIKICFEDARLAIPKLFQQHSIQRCSAFFPDPWWKKRHIKRRIFSAFFLDLLSDYVEPKDGLIHIKTDVLPYGEVIEEMFQQDKRFAFLEDFQRHFLDDLPTEREAYCRREELPYVEFCLRLSQA